MHDFVGAFTSDSTSSERHYNLLKDITQHVAELEERYSTTILSNYFLSLDTTEEPAVVIERRNWTRRLQEAAEKHPNIPHLQAAYRNNHIGQYFLLKLLYHIHLIN